MTGWRHVREWGGACSVLVPLDAMSVTPCGCTTPTPDPASPCGYEGRCLRRDGPDGAYPHIRHVENAHDPIETCHERVPTRCTCGHDIAMEADRG